MSAVFRVIPAVDLLDGQVVRLLRGNYDQSTIYAREPAELVQSFIDVGSDLIHVVDLNAARTGDRSVNVKAVLAILDQAKGRARIEIGGGIRNMDAVTHYTSIGVDRCIIGTAAVTDPDFVREAVKACGAEKIIVGVDALSERVKVSGWETDSGVLVKDFTLRLQDSGVAEIIFTEISRDGALTGPAVDALFKVLSETKMNVIASGGISELADIETLAGLSKDEPRLTGVIVGKAIYEGLVDLGQAIKSAKR